MPGAADALQLTGDLRLVKHNIREQLWSQQITRLIARRPRQFAGMHYHTNRRVVCASNASFQSEQERSLLRTHLAGGLWTTFRVHQRGMITSQCCPYCQQADETEEHTLWACAKWAAARDLHIANVRALAAKVPDLPPFDRWPPCLKIGGLLPDIEPPVNTQLEQHDLPFIQVLHAMFVASLAARKLRDQQAPKLFPTMCSQARSAYPYHQMVGPMPPPPPNKVPSQGGFDTPAAHAQNWTRAWLLQFYASQPGVRDPQTPEVWEQWAQAQLPPRVRDFAQKVLWHKLTVHARVYKRSGTDKCPVCSQKETVKHAMVECPMFKAAAAVIQHYYGPVETGNGKCAVRDMMESDHQEWLLNTNQGWAMWSARSAHWRYRCEVKAGASPVFTSYVTTWVRELCEWVGFYTGERREQWRGFQQSLEQL